MIDGILWILRAGAPWRDLPEFFGPWETVYSRFNGWRKSGLWGRVLDHLQARAEAGGRINWDLFCIDSSVVRAHRAAAGAGGKIHPGQPGRAGRPRPGPVAGRVRDQGAPGLRRRRPRAGGAGDAGAAA